MNTNSATFVQEWTGTAIGALKQMEQWPVAILILASLIVLCVFLRGWQDFPNRLIMAVTMSTGGILNGLLGNTGSVPPTQRHPIAVLALQGVILGFASWAIHTIAAKKFGKKLPFLVGKSGETMMVTKDDIKDDLDK